jgi:D-alanyl-lipoteichoic acid acyltransferase DltB (MBOAT superfamily)
MLFPTGLFAAFFAVVFAVHWSLNRKPYLNRLFLVSASLVFYAAWDWRFCTLLVGSAVWSWAIGLLVAARRPGALALGVAGHLLLLGYFKYANFFIAEFAALLVRLGLPAPALLDVVLPVGISFFTFQGISYIVDVARGDARPEPSPLNVMVYITFFPHLAAGPIVRAAHFLPQVAAPPDPARIPLAMGAVLIASGLFKKVIVANTLATELVDPVFRDPASAGAADILLASYAYAVQIYCDFSAYSDIAIGCAALLGYHFPRNFDQPYRAATLSEFWRRWHISLSSWLRDYLYRPLGGNRVGRTGLNLMLVMLLGGLWHGAAWQFVLWGALHGGGLLAERALGIHRANRRRFGRLAMTLITFHLVVLGWILFRAPDMGTAGAMLAGMADWSAPAQHATWPLAALTLAALLWHFMPPDLAARAERVLARLPSPAIGLAAGLAIAVTMLLGPEGVAPFIYFQF